MLTSLGSRCRRSGTIAANARGGGESHWARGVDGRTPTQPIRSLLRLRRKNMLCSKVIEINSVMFLDTIQKSAMSKKLTVNTVLSRTDLKGSYISLLSSGRIYSRESINPERDSIFSIPIFCQLVFFKWKWSLNTKSYKFIQTIGRLSPNILNKHRCRNFKIITNHRYGNCFQFNYKYTGQFISSRTGPEYGM